MRKTSRMRQGVERGGDNDVPLIHQPDVYARLWCQAHQTCRGCSEVCLLLLEGMPKQAIGRTMQICASDGGSKQKSAALQQQNAGISKAMVSLFI